MRHFAATIHDEDELQITHGESARFPHVVDLTDVYGNSILLQMSAVKANQLRDELTHAIDREPVT